MMIGMDDTIDFFAEVSTILDDDGVETDEDFPERYTLAMNRLRYERDKAVGVKKKRIKKLYGVGYIESCCGSRMFWHDKENKDVIFADCRELETTLCDGRKLIIKPDIIVDFRNMPFQDNTFSLVVFDPPHLVRVGENSWLAKKYGKLPEDWKPYLKDRFDECMRVLKKDGILVFKWNEEQIKTKEVLAVFGKDPLFGDKRSKTRWMVFMKD